MQKVEVLFLGDESKFNIIINSVLKPIARTIPIEWSDDLSITIVDKKHQYPCVLVENGKAVENQKFFISMPSSTKKCTITPKDSVSAENSSLSTTNTTPTSTKPAAFTVSNSFSPRVNSTSQNVVVNSAPSTPTTKSDQQGAMFGKKEDTSYLESKVVQLEGVVKKQVDELSGMFQSQVQTGVQLKQAEEKQSKVEKEVSSLTSKVSELGNLNSQVSMLKQSVVQLQEALKKSEEKNVITRKILKMVLKGGVDMDTSVGFAAFNKQHSYNSIIEKALTGGVDGLKLADLQSNKCNIGILLIPAITVRLPDEYEEGMFQTCYNNCSTIFFGFL